MASIGQFYEAVLKKHKIMVEEDMCHVRVRAFTSFLQAAETHFSHDSSFSDEKSLFRPLQNENICFHFERRNRVKNNGNG